MIRFSLRTLLILVFACGTWFALWLRWDSWVETFHLANHPSPISHVEIRSDHKQILTFTTKKFEKFWARDIAAPGHVARVWDFETGELQRTFDCKAARMAINATASFSPQGQWLLYEYGDRERAYELFDVKTGRRLFSNRDDDVLRQIKYSPSGDRVLIIIDNGREMLLMDSSRPGTALNLKELPEHVEGVCFSMDAKRVLLCGATGDEEKPFYSVFDTENGRLLHRGRGLSGAEPFFSPDGEHVFFVTFEWSSKYEIVLWDWKQDVAVKKVSTIHPPALSDMVNDKYLNLEQEDSSQIYDANNLALLVRMSGSLAKDEIRGRSGETVISYELSTPVKKPGSGKQPRSEFNFCEWDLKTGEMLYKLTESSIGNFEYLRLFRDEKRIVVSSNLATWIWDVGTGANVHILKGFGKPSPDLMRIVVLDQGKNVRIHDIKTGAHLVELSVISKIDSFPGDGTHLVFSSDGRTLLISGNNYVRAFKRRRPESWYGLAWLWEFWVSLMFGITLIWSLFRDRNRLESE